MQQVLRYKDPWIQSQHFINSLVRLLNFDKFLVKTSWFDLMSLNQAKENQRGLCKIKSKPRQYKHQ